MELGKGKNRNRIEDRTGRTAKNDWFLWSHKLLSDAGIVKPIDGEFNRGGQGGLTPEELEAIRVANGEPAPKKPRKIPVQELPNLGQILGEVEAKRTNVQRIMDSVGQVISPRKKIF